jgi:hypothetical protein
MTDTPRPELFDVLEEFCRLYPHWRFGQMIANIASMTSSDIWDMEDEQLIASARRHVEFRKKALGLEPQVAGATG